MLTPIHCYIALAVLFGLQILVIVISILNKSNDPTWVGTLEWVCFMLFQILQFFFLCRLASRFLVGFLLVAGALAGCTAFMGSVLMESGVMESAVWAISGKTISDKNDWHIRILALAWIFACTVMAIIIRKARGMDRTTLSGLAPQARQGNSPPRARQGNPPPYVQNPLEPDEPIELVDMSSSARAVEHSGEHEQEQQSTGVGPSTQRPREHENSAGVGPSIRRPGQHRQPSPGTRPSTQKPVDHGPQSAGIGLSAQRHSGSDLQEQGMEQGHATDEGNAPGQANTSLERRFSDEQRIEETLVAALVADAPPPPYAESAAGTTSSDEP